MQYWARVKDSLETEEWRTEDVTATQDSTFEEFVLAKPLLQTLKRVGYKYPSPIQKEVIPRLLGGESIVARAKNGTGKTGAYAIPLMCLMDPLEQRLQAIVLVPTRELAVQTDAFLKEFGASLHVASTCITGGESPAEDLFGLVISPQIVVGTPGRVVDFLTKGILGLEKLRVLVLDDADKLLENELRECVEPLVERVAGKAQVVALSATFPRFMECFISRYLSHAVTINTMRELTLLGVQQYYDLVPSGTKITRLYVLIHALPFRQMIIFCNSNKRVMMVAQLLRKYKVPCLHIHAGLPQETRLTIMSIFAEGDGRVLVASDLLNRGIDVPRVNAIVNFDLPSDPQTYLHRIGRGGRFGQKAIAISLVHDSEMATVLQHEAALHSHIHPLPSFRLSYAELGLLKLVPIALEIPHST